jgi:hypothetical protein
MSAAILPADSLRRKRFRRSEVDRMRELGILDGQRCELIDKMGQNPPHAQAIRNLFSWLAAIFGLGRVQMQLPIEASSRDSDWSLPEPDIAVLAEAGGEYRKRHPRGDELLLLVEVADIGLRQDLTKKRDLYARASVGEYWVLDLQSRRLIVHACSRHTIAVRDLLP